MFQFACIVASIFDTCNIYRVTVICFSYELEKYEIIEIWKTRLQHFWDKFSNDYARKRFASNFAFVTNSRKREEILRPCQISMSWHVSFKFLFAWFFHSQSLVHWKWACTFRDGSRTAATSKMERFVIIVNGWKPYKWVLKVNSMSLGKLWPDRQNIFLCKKVEHFFM